MSDMSTVESRGVFLSSQRKFIVCLDGLNDMHLELTKIFERARIFDTKDPESSDLHRSAVLISDGIASMMYVISSWLSEDSNYILNPNFVDAESSDEDVD